MSKKGKRFWTVVAEIPKELADVVYTKKLVVELDFVGEVFPRTNKEAIAKAKAIYGGVLNSSYTWTVRGRR